MEEENYNYDAEMAYYSDEEDEIEAMQKRLKELEEETAALRQATKSLVGQSAAGNQDQAAIASESDARSIFVGNVDYGCTPEEVQQYFESCGEVNRVTIRTDKSGQPMGFAYVEFVERGGAEKALAEFDESEFHGRQIKVVAKRTNIPGMKQFRGRRFSRGRGGGRGGRRGYSPYGGYGKAPPPRFKRPAPQRFKRPAPHYTSYVGTGQSGLEYI